MLLRRILLFLSLTLTIACSHSLAHAQALPRRMVAVMPNALTETSGLIFTGPNRLWSHNDGGNPNEIHQIDTNGTVLRTLTLSGVSNNDWEDLTQNDAGEVFVGDFGNNANNRTGLVIYKIPNPDSIAGNSVVPGRIDFSYPDQFDFPPADSLLNFDMEAFVAYGDSLYLFSKNRTNPFDGYTKMYRLPQDTGTYVAELIDSIYLGPGPMLNYWVSGAALSPGKDHLVLLSYPRCWIFSCFQGADFFGGSNVMRTYAFTQIEAAAWKDSTHLYMTDELLNGVLGGNLYEADMTTLVTPPNADLGADIVFFGDTLLLQAPVVPGAQYLWSNGATTNPAVITQAGTYTLVVTAANGCTDTDTIVVTFLTQNDTETHDAMMIAAQPNPFDSATQVHLSLVQPGTLSWKLSDLQGRIVASEGEKTVQAGKWTQAVGANLKSGIYFMEVTFESERLTVKLVKQ
ncbi:MAG: T9SS type A sorting domain-containing protein [Bacteroidetes bacterium]|nr:T9SS type A sorting domain-containing protein [Bacteroidota bacterium]